MRAWRVARSVRSKTPRLKKTDLAAEFDARQFARYNASPEIFSAATQVAAQDETDSHDQADAGSDDLFRQHNRDDGQHKRNELVLALGPDAREHIGPRHLGSRPKQDGGDARERIKFR